MQQAELTPQELYDTSHSSMFQAGITHEYGLRDWWCEAKSIAIPPGRRSNTVQSKFGHLLDSVC